MASALRTVMTVSIGAAAALGASASAANATPAVSLAPVQVEPALAAAVPAAVGPVMTASLNPLAGTGFNPIDNAVGTQIGDLPVSTSMITGQIADGTNLQELLGR
ncbi:hypothetical protein LO772_13210 [Yinghuangia sp. ASG 101]|uniref:hypothetical protein n=1 Tax=Yinghuangia sp. ASG 101 TaxID=2896848 RepID=UPI001E558912|nr:hypothetical protein [Yinghuangia sp. ASG 101]UGQ14455.1 hypothetical protein LO772_13210 [Yinghuangia sp. ASG 101]